jgi:hypothetical protein
MTRTEQLNSTLAALLDPLDYPGDWTQRQREAEEHKRHVLMARIQEVSHAEATIAKVSPQNAALTEWFTTARRIREELVAEILDPALQHRTTLAFGRRENLRLSLGALDRGRRVFEDTGWMLETSRLGQKLRDAGFREAPPIENQLVGRLPFPGSIPETEQHLKVVQALLDDAQTRLAIDALHDAPVSV